RKRPSPRSTRWCDIARYAAFPRLHGLSIWPTVPCCVTHLLSEPASIRRHTGSQWSIGSGQRRRLKLKRLKMKEASIVLDAVEQGVETIHKSDSLSSSEGLLL